MLAVKRERTDIVDILLEAGANVVTAIDEDGNNALHLAAKIGNDSIVKKLLGHSDVDISGHKGRTALLFSVIGGHASTAKILEHAGADIERKDEGGENALQLAIAEGHHKVIKSLIESGFNVNMKGAGSKTPLITAAELGQGNTVKLLLDNGANPLLKDESGETALKVILDKEMLKEREEIIDNMIRNAKEDAVMAYKKRTQKRKEEERAGVIVEYDPKDVGFKDYEIKRRIKSMVPSSVGLREAFKKNTKNFLTNVKI